MTKLDIFFEKFIRNLFAVMFMFVLIIVVFTGFQRYPRKTEFGVNNILLLLISLICISIVSFFIYSKRKKVDNFLIKNWRLKIGTAAVILFIIQIYICYNIYFLTGWDSLVVFKNAESISSGSLVRDDLYFSRYPNNLFITGIFSVIFKVSDIFVQSTSENHLMAIAVMQSAFSSVVGVIIFLMIKDILKSFISAWFGWILYVILLGTSSWLVVPYSDSMGVIFPILIFRLYYLLKNGKHIYLKWCLISLLTYIGYSIKPQIAVSFIAIAIIEVVKFISNYKRDNLKRKSLVIAAVIISFLSASIVNLFFIDSLGFKIDSTKEMGISHFAMMGLNKITDGVYDANDVKFSFNQPDTESRKKANIKVIKQRIREYDAGGFAMHLIRKTLINFNDGTFAFGKEGGFYKQVYKEKNTRSCSLLRSMFYNTGKNYGYYSVPRQAVWLLVLFSILGYIVNKSNFKMYDSELQVLYLSLIGITLFEMIFEPRARYIITYVPFFIIASVIGYKNLFEFVKNRKGLLK